MLVTVEGFSARHGFSTRRGGVSEAPFDSLNLGRAVGDAPEAVEENARRLAQAIGVRTGQLVTIRQVHGDAILEAIGPGEGDRFLQPIGEADALISRAPGAVLCIQTADCVPVLLHAPDVSAVGAIHAGWRGTIAGIAARAVERLASEWGARPERMQAAIGPCIHRCCYEVDEALASRFQERYGESVIAAGAGERPHLDLVEANLRELSEAGLHREKISVLSACTSCDAERFFSHRRDAGRSGRQISWVAL